MSEKKRKRHGDGGERPSKRAAIAQTSRNVKVEIVGNEDVLGPVLASMAGSKFPSNMSLKPYQHYQTSELLLQSSEHPVLHYVAREEKDGTSESLLNDYLGVYDSATGKLQVVKVRKLTMRSKLQQWRQDELMADREGQDEKAADESHAARKTHASKRNALISEFGSKKSKKAIADHTENAITQGRAGETGVKGEIVAPAVLQGMENTTSIMPTSEELAAAVDSSKPRPQANIAAEFPADVYPVDTIVGKDLMALIPVKDWVDGAQADQNISVASQYVAKRIFRLAKAKEIQKLKVLRYILLCVNFNAAIKSKSFKGPKRVPYKDKLAHLMGEDVPGPVVDAIRRKFASENNDMTRWHIDNLMTHVAAAALIVDNFEVDVNDLRDDLRLENKEIKQYFHEIGCKVVAPSETERNRMKISKAEAINHFIAKLKIPLNFPKASRGPRRR